MRLFLLVALALAGCKSEKLLAVEADLASTKARLAVLERKRQELVAKTKQLEVERRTYAKQADEAELARQRLAAAELALDGKPIPDGVLLDDALRTKGADLGALAAQIIQRQLPCDDPADDTQAGPDCSPPPLEDHCEGVAASSPQGFEWACREIVAGGKVPTAAVCDAKAVVDASAFGVPVSSAMVNGDVVRVLFERQGRVIVGDWPPPSVTLYRPPNTSELDACHAENDVEQCVRTCDERFHRLPGGCDDWDEGRDDHGDEEESDEPAELRSARVAAEVAEAEAERARDELAYQECLAPCGADGDSEPEEPVLVALEYRRSPAPGLFELESQAAEADGGIERRTVLISFPAMFEAAAGTFELPSKDTVLALENELVVTSLLEGDAVEGKKVFAGVGVDGKPAGIEVTLDGSEPPVVPGVEELCALAKKKQHGPLVRACAGGTP